MSADDDPRRRWIFRPEPRPDAPLRLYCFPSAGAAGHAYAAWPDRLPEIVDVCAIQLPGRGPRISELPITRMQPLVESACAALLPEWSRGPFALYGHSLGSLAAFEVARHLRRIGGPRPEALFLSGRQAPQQPGESFSLAEASDDELWEELRSYNGTPDELLDDPEVRNYFLPILRADFEIVGNYRFEPGPPLDVPLWIAIGLDDASTPLGSETGWQEQTTADCVFRHYEGEHFFIHSQADLFLAELASDLEELVQSLPRK